MAASFDPPPEQLVNALLRKQAVVFVGSGLSKGAGLPDWADLIAPLKKRLITAGVKDSLDDALDVAEYFEINEGRTELEDTVRDLITPLDLEPTAAHRELVKLPWQSIVTTNYDRLLEKTLEQGKIPHTVLVLDKGMTFGRGDKVNLIKMHGDVYTPGSIILTKTDYDDYHKNFPTIVRYLQGLLVNHVFLFIGFSLTDRNFQRIWREVLVDQGQYGRKSYALLRQPGEMFQKSWARQHLEILGFDEYAQIPDFLHTLSDRLAHTVPSTTEPDPATVTALWRKVASAEYQYLDPRGIFQFERTVVPRTVELHSIFVPPRLRLREGFHQRPDICPECGQDLGHQHPDELQDDDPGRPPAGSTQTAPDEPLSCHNPVCSLVGKAAPANKNAKRMPGYEPQISGVISFKEALARCPRLVVIGDPGAGKSTLVRYLALCAAEETAETQCGLADNPLPLIIELKHYSQALADGRVAGLKDYLIRQACEKQPEVTSKYILDGLAQGRFIILIDGLDETDPARRKQVSDDVLNLMRQFDQCRWLVTSRPAGYEAVRLVDDLPHFTMEPFDDAELARFLANWYRVFAQWDPEAWPDPAAAADKVQKALQARPEIKAVVQNPLIATILVLVHNVGQELPTRRADFYEAAVRTLAGSWETWKYGHKDPDFPEVDHLFIALGETAYRLHRTRVDNLASKDQLRSWLIQTFRKHVGFEERTAVRQVDKFLDRLTGEQTGLVVEKGFSEAGEPMFGFVHLTFQEYFAARYLARQAGHKEWREVLRQYLHNPRWEEVIRLLVGRLDRENATQALLAIRNAGSDYEEVLLRDLFLAAKCLTDDPDVEQGPARQVVDDLMAVVEKWQPDERALTAARRLVRLAGLKRWQILVMDWISGNLEKFHQNILATIWVNCSELPYSPVALMKTAEDVLWHSSSLSLLTTLEFFTRGRFEKAVGSLKSLKALFSHGHWFVRQAAIEVFTQSGTHHLESFDLLATLLNDDVSNVRRAAIEYCSQNSTYQPVIMESIKNSLTHGDPYVRQAALEFFIKSPTDQTAIMDCIKTMLKDDDGYVRQTAIIYFIKSATDQPEIFDSITNSLTAGDPRIRIACIHSFSEIGTDHPVILENIKNCITDDSPSVRQAAIQFFITNGTDQKEILKSLEANITDNDPDVRRAAIQFFTKNSTAHPAVLDRIKTWLSDENWQIRRAAVEFFTHNRTDHPEIRQSIKTRLSDENWQMRKAAIQFFTQYSNDFPNLLNQLNYLLADDDNDVRLAAIRFFTKTGTDKPEILESNELPRSKLRGIKTQKSSNCISSLCSFT